MHKPSYNQRQLTIKRLRNFLRDSVNLEPELELFVESLILNLEYAVDNQNLSSQSLPNSQQKFQH